MKIDTIAFGSIDIKEEQIYSFAQGLPGFEQFKRFVMIDVEETPFTYLQSVEEGELAFLMADPFLFYPTYEFDLPESARELLQVEMMEQVSVRVIVSIKESLEQATINLVAPIVMNVEARTGKQVVLTKTTYSTKHPLFNLTEREGDGDASSL